MAELSKTNTFIFVATESVIQFVVQYTGTKVCRQFLFSNKGKGNTFFFTNQRIASFSLIRNQQARQ